ncbi:unnamed protein product [Sphagnum jensenii]|uniref:R3H domain-containing protein n=1 Tax=Sphagnum jensenii TaxID=128206 RepID=A0ABP0X2B7_9BRYO
MGVPTEVEELAWLVKDNLHTKHLVLSVEELFLEFLEPSYEGEPSLVLEPMLSYERMLLHRLADCFRLVHESVGEGDQRHLVIERSKDSIIPTMLVSDVLVGCYGETHHVPSSPQLLIRNEQKGQQSSLHPGLTLEEREAAYQAARDRIFADSSVGPELEQTGVQRVRPVPVVARRMIAHALGKSSFLSCSPSQKQEVSLLTGRISHGTFVQFGILFCKEGDGIPTPKEIETQVPGKAAKRMFTQALGFPILSPSTRGPSRQASSIKQHSAVSEASTSGQVGHRKAEARGVIDNGKGSDVSNCLSEGEEDWQFCEASDSTFDTFSPIGADSWSVEPTLTKVVRSEQPGRAACRIFSQALGLPNQISSSVSAEDDCHSSTVKDASSCKAGPVGSNDDAQGKEALCCTVSRNDGDYELHWLSEFESCVRLGNSGVDALSGRVNRRAEGSGNKLSCCISVEHGNHPKGRSNRRKPGSSRRLKGQVFQEDQETGELFFLGI